MNELGNDLSSRPADSNDIIESLRRQINLLFGGLLTVSFILTAFLGLQARRAALDAAAVERSAMETSKLESQDNQGVAATYNKLVEFAKTHPDFDRQVLSNFRLNTNSTPAAPVKK